jgi:hypothetical protein
MVGRGSDCSNEQTHREGHATIILTGDVSLYAVDGGYRRLGHTEVDHLDDWYAIMQRHHDIRRLNGAADFSLMTASNVLAVVGGAFLLRGLNWARWLCAAWMGFHIILSMMHSVSELAVHCLI